MDEIGFDWAESIQYITALAVLVYVIYIGIYSVPSALKSDIVEAAKKEEESDDEFDITIKSRTVINSGKGKTDFMKTDGKITEKADKEAPEEETKENSVKKAEPESKSKPLSMKLTPERKAALELRNKQRAIYNREQIFLHTAQGKALRYDNEETPVQFGGAFCERFKSDVFVLIINAYDKERRSVRFSLIHSPQSDKQVKREVKWVNEKPGNVVMYRLHRPRKDCHDEVKAKLPKYAEYLEIFKIHDNETSVSGLMVDNAGVHFVGTDGHCIPKPVFQSHPMTDRLTAAAVINSFWAAEDEEAANLKLCSVIYDGMEWRDPATFFKHDINMVAAAQKRMELYGIEPSSSEKDIQVGVVALAQQDPLYKRYIKSPNLLHGTMKAQAAAIQKYISMLTPEESEAWTARAAEVECAYKKGEEDAKASEKEPASIDEIDEEIDADADSTLKAPPLAESGVEPEMSVEEALATKEAIEEKAAPVEAPDTE